MSARELQGKFKDSSETTRRLTRSSVRSSMGDDRLEAALEEAQRKFTTQAKELERVTEDYRLTQQRLMNTKVEIENHKLRS